MLPPSQAPSFMVNPFGTTVALPAPPFGMPPESAFAVPRWSGLGPNPFMMFPQPRMAGLPLVPAFGAPRPFVPPERAFFAGGPGLMAPQMFGGPGLMPMGTVGSPPLSPMGMVGPGQAPLPVAAVQPAGSAPVVSDVAGIQSIQPPALAEVAPVESQVAGISTTAPMAASLPRVGVLPATGAPAEAAAAPAASGSPIGALASLLAILAGLGAWGWSFVGSRRR
jgi:hypothetical protein